MTSGLITNPLIAENERLRARIKRLEQEKAALEKERDAQKKNAADYQSKSSRQAADIQRLTERLQNAREHINRLEGRDAA